MGRKADYESYLYTLLFKDYDARAGRVVPESESIKLKNDGIYLEAVYLYADMADSTGLVQRLDMQSAAKVVQAYLATVSRVLRHNNGAIRSFDGDRVMAIFVGYDAADRAVRSAFEIRWAVDNIVHENLDIWVDAYRNSSWKVKHRCGLDIGEAFLVRGGVRGDNDLVSIGEAPNIAAKLSEVKGARTWITNRIYDELGYKYCYSSKDSKTMWGAKDPITIGGRHTEILCSDWGWVID